MKTFIALMLVSTAAFAGECCTGSYNYQKYECVNVKNPIDQIKVIRTSDGKIREAK